MQRLHLRHNLPLDWLPGQAFTQRMLNITRGCAKCRTPVLVGANQRVIPTFTTPAKGAQLVRTHRATRMTCGLGFYDNTLIERSIATEVMIEVFCEGVAVVDEDMALGLGIAPANYAILSLWETPGRLDQSVTVHLSAVSYCPISGEWLPLCYEPDSFWSVSPAPAKWDFLNMSKIPPFEELINALREAPAA